ncbi:MAG: class II fructose-bisphosphate aldolase [Clostridiales bacterium]|nr:class II fructose-bisphosphate aldolase [Clostridiales bacterium]
MTMVTSEKMLLNAQSGKYAITAFNVENMEMAQAVISAAEEMHAPVIIQTTPGTLKYAPPSVFAGMVRRMAQGARVPVALHLDHGNGVELVNECIAAGYSSLMIDGSTLPFDGNVTLTRSVVSAAMGLPVEAELGTVGGREDDYEAKPQYTDPREAARFVLATGIFSLAVAIGTAHGIYQGTPLLRIDTLEQIRKAVPIPLVLHGASGVPNEQIRACVKRGICKVNYATELRIAFSNGVKSALANNPDTYDPKRYLSVGREAVRARVTDLIKLCGCNGKA